MSRIKSKTTDYEYKPFEESQDAIQKREEIQKLIKPQQQEFTMQDQLDNTWNQIMNRKEFDYDINGDALYQQYKDNYIQQGQKAMKDTIGKASQLTGGYGNSYAATAGNLAYQSSLQQLNDVVPELYQLAYNKYQDEGNELKNKYAMLTDKEATEYGRYQDALADYYNQYGLLSGEEDKLYNRDYNNWMNAENAAQNIAQSDRDYMYQVDRDKTIDQQWQETFNYNKEQDQIANEQWRETFDYNKKQDQIANEQWQKNYEMAEEELKISQEEHKMVKEQYEEAKNNASSSTKSGFKASYVTNMSSVEIVDTLQMYKEDGDDVGLDAFLHDLLQIGRIDYETYTDYYNMYSSNNSASDNPGKGNGSPATWGINGFIDFIRGR